MAKETLARNAFSKQRQPNFGIVATNAKLKGSIPGIPTMPARDIFFLDIEASGLGASSYPIEIAWAHRHDEKRRGRFLIIPHKGWTHWDEKAEKIHGISRGECQHYGISVVQAANKLNNVLERQVVLCDALRHDQHWLNRLFETAGVKQAFALESVYDHVDVDKLQRVQSAGGRNVHRAMADVLELIAHYNLVAADQHIGSDFDDFLREHGILESSEAAAAFRLVREWSESPEAAAKWLDAPIPSFGKSPKQLINEGRIDALFSYIRRIEEGGYA